MLSTRKSRREKRLTNAEKKKLDKLLKEQLSSTQRRTKPALEGNAKEYRGNKVTQDGQVVGKPYTYRPRRDF